ncbi:MAG: metalloregulator ArsR/SmtB family transcription factor [Candidatus Cloacimonadota bacterium]|nr:metalloregulator ArsR/SmtB family transcription factor [Candidatus Cloacimonadota bacterium]
MKNIKEIIKVLKSLSHQHRLEIVVGLYHNECNVSECQKRMGLPQSTISQHLRVLKDAGIIIPRRNGTQVCYQVVNKFAKKIVQMVEE